MPETQNPSSTPANDTKPTFSNAEFKVNIPISENYSGPKDFVDDDPTEDVNLNEDGKSNNLGKTSKLPDKVEEAKPEAKAGDEKQAKEETKVEAKKPEGLNIPKDEVKTQAKEEVKAKSEVKLEQDAKKTEKDKTGRDYSAYPEEMQKDLKGMSNDAFKRFESVWKEREDFKSKTLEIDKYKKLAEDVEKQGYPSDWLNHPQAYTLHPMFQDAQNKQHYLSFEKDFYAGQLKRIKDGETFVMLQGYKNGEPVYSEEIKPSSQAEVAIIEHFNKASQALHQQEVTLSNIKSNFGNRIQQVNNYVNGIIAKEWPWFGKDDKRPELKDYNELISAVPLEHKNHPSTIIAGLLYASLQQALNRAKDAESKVEKKQIIEKEKEKVEENLNSSADEKLNKQNFARINGMKGNNRVRYLEPAKTFDMEGMD